MRHNFRVLSLLLFIHVFCPDTSSAQFARKTLKPLVSTPMKQLSATNVFNHSDQYQGEEASVTNSVMETGNQQLAPKRPQATDNPLFLKESLDISCDTTSRYWKMGNQTIYSCWVPKVKFYAFHNGATRLRYAVEYFNPDGSLWYSEPMEQIGNPYTDRDSTVLIESERKSDKHQGKATIATGLYGIKITNTRNSEIVFQGRFKVGKFKTGDPGPAYKNQYNFFVDQDWNLPIGYLWLNYNFFAATPRPCLSMWFKGGLNDSDLEARLYYNGEEIGSTDEGGFFGRQEERYSTSQENPTTHTWRRYEISWANFVALASAEAYIKREAVAAKKRLMQEVPGEYTVKVFYKGAPVREAKFMVGADGMLVDNGIAKQNNFGNLKIIIPIKIIGTLDKWNAATWKTDAFYGNPLAAFTLE
jgi:hypothetical protein